MQTNTVDRQYWNIVKGIGIVLVVVGHTCWDFTGFIYLFHLPLFFFVSGYLYNEDKYGDDPYLNLSSKLKSSWIKYVLIYWSLILLHNIFYVNNMLEEGTYYYSKTDIAAKMAEATFGMGKELMGGTLWFVPVLVISSAILGFVVTFSRRVYDYVKVIWIKILVQGILIAGITLVGYIIESRYIDLPAHTQIAWVVMPFLWVGYLMRNYHFDLMKFLNPVVAIICFVLVYIASNHFFLDLVFQMVYPYMHIVAFLGIYVCLYVAKLLNKIKVLDKLFDTFGRASFWIMVVHFPLFKIFDWFYTVLFNNSNFEEYRVIPIAYQHLVPLYLVMGLGLTTVVFVIYDAIVKKLKVGK